MKINVSSAYANPNAVLIQKSQEIVQQIKENLPNKSTGNYPIIDRVDVRGEAECIIPTVDNKKVQLNYLHHKQAVSVKVIDEDGSSIELKQENIPLEIKNLKDPKAFNAFTKNVYAKVSMLSDGNYKIDINHRILGGGGKSKPTTSSEDLKKPSMEDDTSVKDGKGTVDGPSFPEVQDPANLLTTLKDLSAKIDGIKPSSSSEKKPEWAKPEGSITPTSEGRREYQNIGDILKAKLSELKKEIEAQEEDLKLLNGIKSKNTKTEMTKVFANAVEIIKKEIIPFEKGRIFEQTYQQNIRSRYLFTNTNANLQAAQDPVNDKFPLVKRYGIDYMNLEGFFAIPLKKDELHDIEKILFTDAVDYLLKQPSVKEVLENPDQSKYPNNVVLVDIFRRNDQEQIAQEKDSKCPEIHTVVLWKSAPNAIHLIDPSNSYFSKDLTNPILSVISEKASTNGGPQGNNCDINVFNINNLAATEESRENSFFYHTKDNYKKGYSNLESVISSKHRYRDCIDIAVKIAFEINELQLTLFVEKEGNFKQQILEAMSLQLSNRRDLLKHFNMGSANADAPTPAFRALQSTDLQIRRNARLALEMNYKQVDKEVIPEEASPETDGVKSSQPSNPSKKPQPPKKNTSGKQPAANG